MTFAEKAYEACAAKAKLLGRRLGRSEWLETVQGAYEAHSNDGRAAPRLPAKPAQARSRPEIDDAWLCELEANPAYVGVDVRRELGKAQAWASVNGAIISRRRFINWLNKASLMARPVAINGQGQSSFTPKPVQEQEPAGWREWVRANSTNTDWADGPWLALDASARQYVRSQLQ